MKKVNLVGAAILDEKTKKFLVTMTSKDKQSGDLWQFPSGKIEEGESNEEALQREMREQLKCEIKIHKFLMDYTYEYSRLTVRLITYLCTISEGTPKLKEHEKMKWVSKEEIEDLSFSEEDRPTVDMIILNAATP